MSQLFFLFCSTFIITLSGALSPGPVLTATISESMKRGFWAGPLIVLGHAILEVFLLVGIVAGLARWLTLLLVMAVLGVAGGLLLVAMGTHMALTAQTAVAKALDDRGNSNMAVRGPVLTGIITSISNPYWTLWWATIGLGLAATALKLGVAGIASFYAGHILSDLAWYSIVSAAVASGRRICPPWVYRALFIFCGLVLVGLGAFFGSTGIGYFL